MSDPSHAIQAAMKIVPQYVTGEGNAAERLKEVDAETMCAADIIQDAIDASVAELHDEVKQLRDECEQINALARMAGWGQGEIDTSAGIADMNEQLQESNRKLREEVESLRAKLGTSM